MDLNDKWMSQCTKMNMQRTPGWDNHLSLSFQRCKGITLTHFRPLAGNVLGTVYLGALGHHFVISLGVDQRP